ncbi:MAG: hypothetical protein AAF657_28825 [Acidobacteriota bacterium]
MRPRFLILLTALLLTAACHPGYIKKSDPTWNRRVEALSVLPDRGENGQAQAMPFFSVQAENIVETVDLSTRVDLTSDGEVVDSLEFSIIAHPPGTQAAGCGTCPPFQVCWIIDGLFSRCGSPPLICDPLNLPSVSGELGVRLTPTAGSAPESAVDDDHGGIRFENRPLLAVAGGGGSIIERLN